MIITCRSCQVNFGVKTFIYLLKARFADCSFYVRLTFISIICPRLRYPAGMPIWGHWKLWPYDNKSVTFSLAIAIVNKACAETCCINSYKVSYQRMVQLVCGSWHCIINDNTASGTFSGAQLQWWWSTIQNEFPSIVLELVELSSSLWHSLAIAIIAMWCIFKIVVCDIF